MQLYKKSSFSLITLTSSILGIPKSGKVLHRKKQQSLVKVTLGTLYLLLVLALPAMACGLFNESSLFASSLFTLPAISSVYGYGLPLLAIVSIEAFILHKRELIPYLKAFLLAAWANGFYLIASIISYATLSLPFPISLIGSLISAAMCLSFCQRTGHLKQLNQSIFTCLVYLLFIGLEFARLFLAESLDISISLPFIYVITAGLILIGFIFGFVAKGFAIALFLKEKHPSLADTVMSMHVGSFCIIPIAYYLMQAQRW